MRRATLISMLVCAGAAAQDRNQLRDALEWTMALRGRMTQMTNKVVSVHGLAAAAALVCQEDRVTASGMYREAITALHNLPASAFSEKGTTVLPSASFTGLWKFVVPNALKCDPDLAPIAVNPRTKERIDAERRAANSTLARAWGLIDPTMPLDKADQIDRSAQLANAALDAADPDVFDFALLAKVMCHLAERAPELSDDLWDRALEIVTTGTAPSPDNLQALASFLFTSPRYVEKPEPNDEHDTFTVSGATIENLMAMRHSANPDNIESLIGIEIRLLKDQIATARDPVVLWALGWQLLPKARDLTPDRVKELEDLLAPIQAQYTSAASEVQSRLGAAENPDQESGDPAHRDYWLVGQVQNALGAGRIDRAHVFLERIGDQSARHQLAGIVTFRESAIAVAAHGDQALSLANLLPGGIKRALLYIAIIADTKDASTAIQMQSLAMKDVAPLPAELRVRLLSAIGAAMLRTNPDIAMSTLQELVRAANDVYVNPRRGRFDPASARRIYNPNAATSSGDSSLILAGTRGFYEAVQTELGRHNFVLRVPAVAAFTIAALLGDAGKVDPARLEANVLELHDENTRAGSLVALGAVRIKMAKSEQQRK